MKHKSITQEIVDNSQILSKASYTDIIKLDSWLSKTINNFLLKSFSQEIIDNFWDWFDRVQIDNYNSVAWEPNDIYGTILVRVRDTIKQNNENSRLYIDWEDQIDIDENFYDILSEWHLVYINKIRSFINQILIYEIAQDIYIIKKNTEKEIWSNFEIKYNQNFIKKILDQAWIHNNIANIVYLFEFYGKFDESWYYTSELIKLSESEIVTINDIYHINNNEYNEMPEEDKKWYDKYINNFISKLFSNHDTDIFDSYKTILDDHKKLDDIEFILKNASHHISKSVNDWNYKMLKLNQRLSYRMTKMDQIINANSTILAIISKVCWSEYEVTSWAILKDIKNLDQSDNNFYTVTIWVNEELEILVYIIKISENETKYEQVWTLWSYIISDPQNLFDVITTFSEDQNIYQAVGMSKEKINFNL